MNENRPFQHHEAPTASWVIGGVFLLGAVIFGIRQGIQSSNLIIVAVLALIGIAAFLFGSTVDITANPETRRVILKKKSLVKKSTREIPYEDISDIRVATDYDDEGDETYRVEIVLRDGNIVPIRPYYSSGQRKKLALAERLRDAIGIVPPPPAGESKNQKEGETNGVHWKIESFQSGTQTITRWSSTDFLAEEEHFLLLAQKIPGAMEVPTKSKLMEKVSALALSQAKKIFQFDDLDFPNIKKSKPYPLPPRLEAQYLASADDAGYAQRILIPWVAAPLAEWAERNPIPKGSADETLVLFSPLALYIVTLRAMTDELEESITALGVELVRALGGGA